MVEAITVVPLSPMRKIIAARMTEATQTIPHFRLTSEVELDALMDLRQELNEGDPSSELSLNDLLIKACATALMDTPGINIQWSGTDIRQFSGADISVVMAVKGGLSTPIVRNADAKSIWEISREVRELAKRANANSLKVDQVLGGSFSLSNLGMYGVDQFDAIINAPQCAILAIGTAKPRLVVSRERQMRIATVMRATLSVDHRALDGVIGAEFLAALRQRLEQPAHLRPSESV